MASKMSDLRKTLQPARDEQMQRLMHEESVRAFDMARGPLLRFTLLRLGEQEHLLLVVMHHIISDGWSMGVFFGELGKLYDAYLTGTPVSLPALQIQYADFARWQRQTIQGNALEEDCR